MKRKISLMLVFLLMLGALYAPAAFAAWADNQTVMEDFEEYEVAEGEFKLLKDATNNQWTQMNSTYATAYLTKQNENTYAVFKDFKADAIINSYLTKMHEGKHWYEQSDGGKDRLKRDMMMRFQYYGVSDVTMNKDVTYNLTYDFKYTSGEQPLSELSDRSGFIFPKELVTSYSGSGYGSYPGLSSLTSAGGQQLYGTSSNMKTKENGWIGAEGPITFNTIMQASTYGTDDAAELDHTGVNYLAFEFKGMAATESAATASIFTMLQESFAEYITELSAGTDNADLKAAAVTDFTDKLAKADFKICLDNITFKEVFIDDLSLSGNKTHYVGEDRAASALKIQATKPDGTVYDMTGAEGVTYTSSDESVFRFTEGNLLESTGKIGKAVITATYKEVSASVVMIRQNQKTDQDYNVLTETMVNGYNTYKTTSFAGHDDDTSLIFGTSAEGTSAGELWQLRHCVNRTNNWFGRGYRSLSGWFYDDLENPVGIYFGIRDSYGYASYPECHVNFEADYSYGEFDWTGMKSYSANGKFEATPGSKYYFYGTEQICPRSKGWHQVTISLEKNPEAKWGWTLYYYFDGEMFKTIDITPSTSEGEPYFEIRGNVYYKDKTGVDTGKTDSTGKTIYRYELYPSYYDDFMMGGALDAVDTSVKLTCQIGENGTMTVNGETKNNGDILTVEQGSNVTVTATPADGYVIDTMKAGDSIITVDASGSVTLENVRTDTVLSVTFKLRETIAPNVSGNTEYNYFKTENGKPTAYVYGKLNQFYVPEGTTAQYGMRVWVSGDSEKAIVLPVINPVSGQPETAQPEAAFAIKVYGEAITADKTYIFQPYVGENNGEEMAVTFAE